MDALQHHFPAGPPSPPDSNATPIRSAKAPQHRPLLSSGTFDSAIPLADPPSRDSRTRRQPSIVYNSSGFRDFRARTPSVTSKLLVIVVPPPSLAQEHGSLGHTLSTGPIGRLGQGIIMPLFPTMYGQITAITREFNFPSSAGICLYYCYTDNGINITPRLSDDVWQAMWGLSTDVHSPGGDVHPPLVGKIEFDIDMTQARWWTAWLSTRVRDNTETPIYQAPSSLPASNHFRGDSRMSFPYTASEQDFTEQFIEQRSAPVTRHVPRKLSLLDKFDSTSPKAESAKPPVSSRRQPYSAIPTSHILSPITQLEEPKTAQLELDEKVKSWRASAVLSPIPLEAVLQPPSGGTPLDELPKSPSTASFHIEDYAFSISSHGPDDNYSIASGSQYRLPSIHIADRVNGSVCLTESYCTSPGPSDYSLPLEAYYEAYAGIMSPDIAARMYEDSPMGPLTATSWGPPSHYTFSLASEAYEPSLDLGYRTWFSRPSSPATATSWGAPSYYGGYDSPDSQQTSFSVHLAHRGEFSRPVTPQTATSWGAPSYPPSPVLPSRAPSPDLGQRSIEDSENVTLGTWRATPWGHVWPYIQPKVTLSLPEKKRSSPPTPGSCETVSMAHGYPNLVIYPPVYPHFDLYPVLTSLSSKFIPSLANYDYPNVVIYPAVYPHLAVYPAVLKTDTPKAPRALTNYDYPHIAIYPAVYPHFDLYPTGLSSVSPMTRSAKVPAAPMAPVEIPAKPWNHSWPYNRRHIAGNGAQARPWNQVWPYNRDRTHGQVMTAALVAKPWNHVWQYNRESLKRKWGDERERPWNHVWPYNRDRMVHGGNGGDQRTRPWNHVWPHGRAERRARPWNHVWPYSRADQQARPWNHVWPYNQSSPHQQRPWNHVWPYSRSHVESDVSKDSREGVPWSQVWPYNRARVSGAQCVALDARPVALSGANSYPFFDIYPAVYPFNLDQIYPSTTLGFTVQPRKQIRVTNISISFSYPFLTIYPSVYPHNLSCIYPSVPSVASTERRSSRSQASNPVRFAQYPIMEIYPSVYPHNLKSIYPALPTSSKREIRSHQSWRLDSHYPFITIYPAVYPYNMECIYPTKSGSVGRITPSVDNMKGGAINVKLNQYPFFDIYPAAYPFNLDCIYPSVRLDKKDSIERSAQSGLRILAASYPVINLYPAVYPFFDIYPQISGSLKVNNAEARSLPKIAITISQYPIFDIYPSQYPHLDIYKPQAASRITPILSSPTLRDVPKRSTSLTRRSVVPPKASQSSLSRVSKIPLPRVPLPSLPSSQCLPSPSAPRNRKSGRLTHAELHAIVAMEKRVANEDSFLRRSSSTRTVPRELNSDTVLRFSTITEESDLRRASTFPPPVARPRPSQLKDNSAARKSLFMSPRGLGTATMSSSSYNKESSISFNKEREESKSNALSRSASVSSRKSLWENRQPESSSQDKQTRPRDSLVFQRVKAFNSLGS